MSKEYIEREALLKKLSSIVVTDDFNGTMLSYGKDIAGDIIIKTPSATDVVPVDDMFCEMMNWAARYAIGRRTYAASDTANYILRLVDKLDDKTLNCLKNDIEKASSLGDDCDKKEWLKLLDAVNKELERRKNER